MDNLKGSSTHDKIELRSEKVRKILGEVPNNLVRWGIVIVCSFFALPFVALSYIDFPHGNGESILEHVFFRM